MNTDAELARWSRRWQAQSEARNNAPLAEDLKRRVARQSRLMKIGLIVPILVTLGIGGGFTALALTLATEANVLLITEIWLFIVVTWIGSLWIARGTWRPLTETTAAFVDISIRRCQSNISAATFGVWLYVAQLSFMLLWKFFSTSIDLTALLTAWPVILIGWVGLPAFLAWRFWFVRRQRAALDRFLELQRQLDTGLAD
jgi:hypothetical protein